MMKSLNRVSAVGGLVAVMVVAGTAIAGSRLVPLDSIEGIRVEGHTVTFDEQIVTATPVDTDSLKLKWKKKVLYPVEFLQCGCAEGKAGGNSCHWDKTGNKATCTGSCGGESCVIGSIVVNLPDPVQN
ncbi:MAG: hypothetical protein ABMA64_31270 [Myxococcota bacterium]